MAQTTAGPLASADERALDAANASNPCSGPFGAVYDSYIGRRPLARAVARLVWGIEAAPLYEAMDVIGEVPAGGTVVDIPCGGGVALRGLRPGQEIHYVGIDLDSKMLARTARRAQRRGLAEAELVRADAEHLPLDSGMADLCLAFGGLHCFADPHAALAEMVRVLRPGGELCGSTFISEGSRRQRFLFARERARTGLPALWSLSELETQLSGAGLIRVGTDRSSGHVVFRAAKPARTEGAPA